MTHRSTYQPPVASQPLLGNVVSLLNSSRTHGIRPLLHGARHMAKLPGGEVYYDSALELDTDGSVYAAQDGTGQSRTSLRYADGSSVDADDIPYFVLPGHFYTRHRIQLGDVAAVIYGRLLAFAVFADVGPAANIGEGSIALHRALGHET